MKQNQANTICKIRAIFFSILILVFTAIVSVAQPVMTSFTARPTTLMVGQNTILTTQFSGGDSPFFLTISGPKGLVVQKSLNVRRSIDTLRNLSSDASGTYSAIVRDTNQRSDTATVSLSIVPKFEVISFAATPNTITDGENVQFTASLMNGTAPYHCVLTGTGGFVKRDTIRTQTGEYRTSASPTVAQSGTFILKITDSGTPRQTDTTDGILVTVNPGLLEVSDFKATPSEIIEENTVVFTATIRGGKAAYRCSLSGPGNFIAQSTVPNQNGSFRLSTTLRLVNSGNFTLKVRDANSQTPATPPTVPVKILPRPIGISNFKANPNQIAQDNSVEFSATLSGGLAPYTCSLQGPGGFLKVDTVPVQNGAFRVSYALSLENSGQFILSVKDKDGNKSPTDPKIPVTVLKKVSISSHPENKQVWSNSTINFGVAATGGGVLSYQWYKNNSLLNDQINHISGCKTQTLTVSTVALSDSGKYQCVVSNTVSSVLSNEAYLVVYESVSIRTHPSNVSATIGSNATFSVQAMGREPISYQWQTTKNLTVPWQAVGNGTTNTLVISPVTSTSEGVYRCIASNGGGVDTSQHAGLTILQPPVITKDLSKYAFGWTSTLSKTHVETLSIVAIGDSLRYQWYKDSIPLLNQNKSSLLFTITSNTTGAYTCLVFNRIGSDTSLTCQFVTKQSATVVIGLRDTSVYEGNDVLFEVFAKGDSLQYAWFCNGVSIADSPNESKLKVKGVTKNTAGSYSCKIFNPGDTVLSTAVVSMKGPIKFISHPTDISVYSGKSFVLNAKATGTPPINYQWLQNEIILSGAVNEQFIVDRAVIGQSGSYKCVAYNTDNSRDTSKSALVRVLMSAFVKIQPVFVQVTLGMGATLNVEGDGHPPLAYQWYKDTIALPFANSPTLTIPHVSDTDVTVYRCKVSNGPLCENGEYSDWALISVDGPLSMVRQPENKTVNLGQPVTFEVFVSGSELKTYQWYKNGIKLNKETAWKLSIPAATSADGGFYSCVVANAIDTVKSRSAELLLKEIVVVENNPQSVSKAEGESTFFTLSVKGIGPFYYQWYFNSVKKGKRIKKLDYTDTLFLSMVSGSDVGEYYCAITNDSTDTVGVQCRKARLSIYNASLLLLFPNGKELFIINDRVQIQWKYIGTGIEKVRLDFSADMGSTFMPIATNIPNTMGDNTYQWTVPMVISNFCQIKVTNNTVENSNYPSDINDSLFSINQKIAIKNVQKNASLISQCLIHPNPVILRNTSGVVSFTIKSPEKLRNGAIIIADPLGRQVIRKFVTLQSMNPNTGSVVCTWDLCEKNGEKVKPGTYLAIIHVTNLFGVVGEVIESIGIKE